MERAVTHGEMRSMELMYTVVEISCSFDSCFLIVVVENVI
jgi:hypothetical protein